MEQPAHCVAQGGAATQLNTNFRALFRDQLHIANVGSISWVADAEAIVAFIQLVARVNSRTAGNVFLSIRSAFNNARNSLP